MININTETPSIVRLDPYWDAYFRWPADYFPFNLPACSVEKHQYDLDHQNEATVTWDISYNLELECGLVSAEKHLLHDMQPRKGRSGEHFRVTHLLSEDQLSGPVGFTFTWAFYIPMPAYMPKHPMGIIQLDPQELKGKNTVITIRDTRPKNQ
ncbi:hypothetical protein SAMN05444360_11943 [Chryseobacterium carnipullorum]|uniref:hypothetical protein n=1 Tax=Chryseobacterium carnipullorum TaxID=1124835 RepID=UPI0009124BE2|nr:hypothetical protein [Chryseobacterium carnipullorum]SHM84920.1 hypothetical protein SAMN05444360_11943 [Chryseobacterium carnipullorum]